VRSLALRGRGAAGGVPWRGVDDGAENGRGAVGVRVRGVGIAFSGGVPRVPAEPGGEPGCDPDDARGVSGCVPGVGVRAGPG
jgi:hypothetical protein